ncbi:hypothetical protein EJB05_22483, partial [Eragrostis curvula]
MFDYTVGLGCQRNGSIIPSEGYSPSLSCFDTQMPKALGELQAPVVISQGHSRPLLSHPWRLHKLRENYKQQL